jgi:hypothetical protein
MMKLGILTKKGKIYTEYSEKNVCLNDAALMLYELEKTKKELLKKKFKLELRIDHNKEFD